MFPIAKTALSFGEIADYWSREIPASWDEVLRTLESAWWLGELRGNSGPTRLERLRNMFTSMRHRDDLGIIFLWANVQAHSRSNCQTGLRRSICAIKFVYHPVTQRLGMKLPVMMRFTHWQKHLQRRVILISQATSP
jgi:hypothetical protein